MDQLIFTRYLYPQSDVKQSLLLSLLERNSKEALFWAYELYYSGFEDETFTYLSNIYESYYKSDNPDLEKKLFTQGLVDECSVGSIILTLSSRKYQICDFVEVYYNVKDFPRTVHPPSKFNFVIAFKKEDLVQYKMVLPQKEKTRHYLNLVCKHSVRREYNKLFETSCDDYNNALRRHWLYFASRSPAWLYRIRDFGGSVNHEKKEVEFPDDDLLDSFYDSWGLEPDEQSTELQEKIIGNCSIQQLSINDFCVKYGGREPSSLVNSLQISK
jgi:hypothetical protein